MAISSKLNHHFGDPQHLVLDVDVDGVLVFLGLVLGKVVDQDGVTTSAGREVRRRIEVLHAVNRDANEERLAILELREPEGVAARLGEVLAGATPRQVLLVMCDAPACFAAAVEALNLEYPG